MSIVREQLLDLLQRFEGIQDQARVVINVETRVYEQEQEADRKKNKLAEVRELPDSGTRWKILLAMQEKRDAWKAIKGIREIFKSNGWKYATDEYGKLIQVDSS